MAFPTAAILDALGLSKTVNTLPNAGQNAKVDSLGVVIASDDDIQAKLGIVTETAPASDTASSGLNGRLQRIAQRLTSLIAQLPASLGIKTAAASLSITHASDDSVLAATGAVADTAYSGSGSGSIVALLKWIGAQLVIIAGAAVDVVTPSPVKIDQTTPGTTNAVAISHIGSTAVASGAGAVSAGVIRTTQASDSPLVAAFGTTGTAKTYTGTFVVAATALTRPANTTAYTALDSISDNATAGSVTANVVTLSDTTDHPIDISEILLASTDTGPGTAAIQIRLHLFNSNPTTSSGVVGGDNAAWSNKQAGWVGSFSGTMRAFSDGSRGVLIADEGTLRLISPVSGAKTLYWQLQAIGGFTPSANSTTFTPTFKGFQARPA